MSDAAKPKVEDEDLSLFSQAKENLRMRVEQPMMGGEIALKNDLLAAFHALIAEGEITHQLLEENLKLKKELSYFRGLNQDGYVPLPPDLEQRVNSLEDHSASLISNQSDLIFKVKMVMDYLDHVEHEVQGDLKSWTEFSTERWASVRSR